MHTVRFFPIGNADSCLIELENGRRALFDFADMRNASDPNDRRCNLPQEIRSCIGEAKEIDVVAFTHFDKDHCHCAKDFFYLEHAAKYQGEDRIKIKAMWVPANAILETGVEGQARTLRAEARYRFIKGEGIRVFSRPEKLDNFLISRGIEPAKRRNLITDAGSLCPEFSLEQDGLQFFVHSPFAKRQNGTIVDRNDNAIFVQATFECNGRVTKMILSADVSHEVINDIIEVTRYKRNDQRLEWDINNVPHHSSYLSLSGVKGETKTNPNENIRWLYESQGNQFGILVSTSFVIPSEDSVQPPHRQAAAYYKDVANSLSGQYVVTMTHPTEIRPKPLVIEIGDNGASIRKDAGGATAILSTAAPRAGYERK